MSEQERPTGLALLRVPFPAHQISKLPKPTSKDATKGRCKECGGWHGLPAVHLDYVGHAALTDRLLDADPSWTWEPIADPAAKGLPSSPGGMWIKLTVCGVTRLGYGHPDGKTGGDAVKETIGDALRNAAMRFGAALDLWHKGDLHKHGDEATDAAEVPEPTPAPAGFEEWRIDFEATADNGGSALAAAWRLASEEFRAHYNATVSDDVRAKLRTKAKAADAKAHEQVPA